MTIRAVRGALWGVGLLVWVALVGVACGGSGQSGSGSTTASAPADDGSASADAGGDAADAGSAGDTDTDTDTEAEGTVSAEEASAEEASAEEASAVELSDEDQATVDRILGWSAPTLAAREADVRSDIDLANRREEYIADCMARQGFEYFPIQQDFVVELIVDPDVRRDTPEWTEKYGFGISTLATSLDQIAPDGVGYDPAWLRKAPPGPEDNPNAAYYAGLDDAGRKAMDKASSGDDGFGGCRGDAERLLPDPGLSLRQQLEEELVELDERVRATAAYLDATSEVDACMEVPDFVFEGYQSFEEGVMRRMFEVGLIAPLPEEEVTIISSESPPPPGPDLENGSPEWRRAMAEVQQFEILMATEFERCIGRDAWFDQVDRIAAGERRAFLAENHRLIRETIHQGES